MFTGEVGIVNGVLKKSHLINGVCGGCTLRSHSYKCGVCYVGVISFMIYILTPPENQHVPWRGTILKGNLMKCPVPTINFQGNSLVFRGVKKHLPTTLTYPSSSWLFRWKTKWIKKHPGTHLFRPLFCCGKFGEILSKFPELWVFLTHKIPECMVCIP